MVQQKFSFVGIDPVLSCRNFPEIPKPIETPIIPKETPKPPKPIETPIIPKETPKPPKPIETPIIPKETPPPEKQELKETKQIPQEKVEDKYEQLFRDIEQLIKTDVDNAELVCRRKFPQFDIFENIQEQEQKDTQKTEEKTTEIQKDGVQKDTQKIRILDKPLTVLEQLTTITDIVVVKVITQICMSFLFIYIRKNRLDYALYYLRIIEYIKKEHICNQAYENIFNCLLKILSSFVSLKYNEVSGANEVIEKYIDHLNKLIDVGTNDFLTVIMYKYYHYSKEDYYNAKISLALSANPVIKILSNLYVNMDVINRSFSRIEDFFTMYENMIINAKNKLARTVFDQHSPATIPTDLMNILMPHMYLSYLNYPTKKVFEKLADFYSYLYQSMVITDKIPLNIERYEKTKKIRIGYISYFYSKIHSVLRDRAGIITHFPPDKFEEYTIYFDKPKLENDLLDRHLYMNSQHTVILINNTGIKDLCTQVKNLDLDVLVYSDIGMFPTAYYMALSRLAPIQITTWGHSDTSGLPNMDYFISSKYYEVPDKAEAQEHYSEKLILLDDICTYYYRPLLETEIPKLPSALELEKALNIPLTNPKLKFLTCLHSEQKFKPPYVQNIDKLLTDDRTHSIRIILLENGIIHGMFKSFLSKENLEKCYFVKRLGSTQYQSIINLCFMVLDTYPFGGCNMSFEAFFYGKPVITFPTKFINGRFTYGLYAKMGIMTCIANSFVDYNLKIMELIHNEEQYKNICKLIKENNHKIFECAEASKEWYSAIENVFYLLLVQSPSGTEPNCRYAKENCILGQDECENSETLPIPEEHKTYKSLEDVD